MQGEPSESTGIVQSTMNPLSEELSHQVDMLFQIELSAFKSSNGGPGEHSPKAFGRGCWPGGLSPKMCCASSLTALGCCIQVICVPVCHLF